MSGLDYLIFILYMFGILGVGFYHYRRNKSEEDYYVGGRSVKPTALGLSIVATDVGGGFSIGLGGVGFLMGLSGSWLLFTGFLGAWLTAVFIIPRIKGPDVEHRMLTYPDFLRFRYNNTVALVAAVISCIGYLMFTGSQIQAGATLASETVMRTSTPFGWDPFTFSLFAMSAIIIGYTVMGGIKAVIYTDYIQWLVLLFGLVVLAIPLAIREIGGLAAMRAALPPEFFRLDNINKVTFINWMAAIVPIWLVGMTLYQRMFACKGVKEGRKAWYIAGFFEWPVMAFMGVFLGMCSRVIFPELTAADSELGLPRLINEVLPIGITGIVVAAYFSAIMSTADSCLMASSGNLTGDILGRYVFKRLPHKRMIHFSQVITLILGLVAVAYALRFSTVIEGIFSAYNFLVAGLFFPTLGAFFWRRANATGALWGMLTGGLIAVGIPHLEGRLAAGGLHTFLYGAGLDPVVYGLAGSAIVFVAVTLFTAPPPAGARPAKAGTGDTPGAS